MTGPRSLPRRLAARLGLSTSTVPVAVPGLPARSVAASATVYTPGRRGTAQVTLRVPRPITPASVTSAAPAVRRGDPHRHAGDLRQRERQRAALAPAHAQRAQRQRGRHREVGREVRLRAAVDGGQRAVAQARQEVAQQDVVAEVGLARDRAARVVRPGAGVVQSAPGRGPPRRPRRTARCAVGSPVSCADVVEADERLDEAVEDLQARARTSTARSTRPPAVATRTPAGGAWVNITRPARICGSSSGSRPSRTAAREIACRPVPCASALTHGGRPPSNVK